MSDRKTDDLVEKLAGVSLNFGYYVASGDYDEMYDQLKVQIRKLLQSRQPEKVRVTNSEIVKFVMDFPIIPLAQDYVERWLEARGFEMVEK